MYLTSQAVTSAGTTNTQFQLSARKTCSFLSVCNNISYHCNTTIEVVVNSNLSVDTSAIGLVATIFKLSTPKSSLALFFATWLSISAMGTIAGESLFATESVLLSLSFLDVSFVGSVKLYAITKATARLWNSKSAQAALHIEMYAITELITSTLIQSSFEMNVLSMF